MTSEHRIAYALKKSPFLPAIEEFVAASPLTQQAKQQAIAAYAHLQRLALQGDPPNLYWLALVLEASGLRDIRCEDDSTVAATIPNGATIRLSFAADSSLQIAA